MRTGKAIECPRHLWDMGKQERNFLGPDSGCPYCALEKRRKEQIEEAELAEREWAPGLAACWWRKVEETEEKLVALYRLQRASRRAISPPQVRERSSAAGH